MSLRRLNIGRTCVVWVCYNQYAGSYFFVLCLANQDCLTGLVGLLVKKLAAIKIVERN